MDIKQYLSHVNFKRAFFKKNQYIVLHYTANNGDTALNNCKYFDETYRGASANYFVDETSIYQCVRDTDIAWHVGAHKYYNDCRNENSIGIELCSRLDSSGKYYFKDKTVNNAVELTAFLCEKYGIEDIDKYVVRHWDCTHKKCPAPWVENEAMWVEFKERVKEKIMNNQYGYEIYDTIEEVPDWAQESIKKALDKGVLKGTGKGLKLTLIETRVICWLDRCGCLDNIE